MHSISRKGVITALVVIGPNESDQIKTFLKTFGKYFVEIFNNAGSLNGCKWLMLEVNDESVLDDIKEVLLLKDRPKTVRK